MDTILNDEDRSKYFSTYKTNKINIQERNNSYLIKQVSPSLTNQNNTPHFLMELSQDEYKILKPNSIHIVGVSFTKCSSSLQRNMISEFHFIQIGRNIQTTKVGMNTTINMDRIKRKKILITINKSECHTSSSNVQILNTRLDLRNNKKSNLDYVGSGIVVLMMGIKKTKKQNSLDDKRVVWSRLII